MIYAPLIACLLAAAPAPLAPPSIGDATPTPNAAGDGLGAQLSESEQDKLTAAKLAAEAARLKEQGEPEAALRKYQRAWRWDPASAPPLKTIVPLAFETGRLGEAVRYTETDIKATPPELLRRLAIYQVEQGDYDAALRFYRAWWAQRPVPAAETSEQRLERLISRLQRGRVEYLTGDAAAASKSFAVVQQAIDSGLGGRATTSRLAAAMGGASGAMWEVFGRCHLEAGKPALALEAFRRLRGSPLSAPRADYWLARLDAEQGKPLVAYERLMNYFEAGDIGSTDRGLGDQPYALLRRLLEQVNDRDGLRTDLERLSGAGDPDTPRRPYAMAALARAKATAGDDAGAEAIHLELLRLAPDIEESLTQRSAAWLIRNYGLAGRLIDLADALPLIGGAMDDFRALEETLDLALANERSAARLLTALSRWSPGERPVGAVAAAAWIARRAERFELADRLHTNTLDRLEGEAAAEAALAWAVELVYEIQPRRAARALRRGIDRRLWGADAWAPHFYLATALSMTEQHDAAVEAAREAARRAPDSADVVARVAWVLYGADRIDEARVAYRELIETFDDNPDPDTRIELRDARQTLSFLTLQRGDVDAAVEWLEQVLDEFPDDPGALNDLAYLWSARDLHLERALRMARRAVEAAPNESAYLDTLAWAQFRSGDAGAALATDERALELERLGGGEPDGEILDHWGDILASLGRQDEAARAWRRAAAQLETSNPEAAAKVRGKLAEPPAGGE
ncbi:MAG: tetratricopeptide repeat protein [Planctomycetota bacterium]